MADARGGLRYAAAGPQKLPENPGKRGTVPRTIVTLQEEEDVRSSLLEPWCVILFNDDVHSFDEVIVQVVKATGCSMMEAERIAWRTHISGLSRVFEGEMDRCLTVQGVLREIELVTEIRG